MITVDHLSNLGPALRQLRLHVRMTQGEVCAPAGLMSPQLSRWENGRETPTIESVVKVLAAMRLDLADLQRALVGEELYYPEGEEVRRRDRERREALLGAHAVALRAHRQLSQLEAEGALPFEEPCVEAEREEREALFELLRTASGQFINDKEGYFGRLSNTELWGHFAALKSRFKGWVPEGVRERLYDERGALAELPDVLPVPPAEESRGGESRRSGPGGDLTSRRLVEILQKLDERLGSVEGRLDGLA